MSWNKGLFNCCGNCCNCLFVAVCPCWTLGKIADHVGDSCCMCSLLSIVALPCLICMERGKMRAKYAIDGGSLGDAVIGCFCPCCGMAQMMNQMEGGGMAKDGDVITAQPKSLGLSMTPHVEDNIEDTSVVSQQPA